MKIIAVDIGNTNVHLAVVENRKVLKRMDVANSRAEKLSDALKSLSAEASDQTDVPVAICSVVPEITHLVTHAARMALDIEAQVIGKDIPLPLKLDLTDTTTVGADRVVSAAMAFERMGTAVAMVDFGTAITVDCVNRDGVFVGGAIMPGVAMALNSLAEKTKALPAVDIAEPEGPWGRTTEQAILTGVVCGSAGAVRGIIEQYATALGYWPEVIATGGDAELVVKYADFVHAVVPDLLLMGIELTHEQWRQGEKDSK